RPARSGPARGDKSKGLSGFMGRMKSWQRRLRHLPRPARLPLAATMVPLSLTVACLMGLAQLRPARTALAGSVALSLGFGAGLAVMNPGEEGMAGPSSFAADVGVASVAPSLAELAPAPEVPEIRRLPSEPGARAEIFDRVVQVGKGDTLMKLLIEAGVDRADAYGAIEALRDVYDPRHLRVGQEITLTYAAAGQNPASL